jgi:hypothetical protein
MNSSTNPASLRFIEPDVAQLIVESDQTTQRRVADAVSRFAIARVGLNEIRLENALKRLTDGQFGDTPERRALQVLIDELDSAAWQLQADVELGAADYAEYQHMFMKARAANAVWCALSAEPLEAVADAVYEARAAVGGIDLIRPVLQEATR